MCCSLQAPLASPGTDVRKSLLLTPVDDGGSGPGMTRRPSAVLMRPLEPAPGSSSGGHGMAGSASASALAGMDPSSILTHLDLPLGTPNAARRYSQPPMDYGVLSRSAGPAVGGGGPTPGYGPPAMGHVAMHTPVIGGASGGRMDRWSSVNGSGGAYRGTAMSDPYRPNSRGGDGRVVTPLTTPVGASSRWTVGGGGSGGPVMVPSQFPMAPAFQTTSWSGGAMSGGSGGSSGRRPSSATPGAQRWSYGGSTATPSRW